MMKWKTIGNPLLLLLFNIIYLICQKTGWHQKAIQAKMFHTTQGIFYCAVITQSAK